MDQNMDAVLLAGDIFTGKICTLDIINRQDINRLNSTKKMFMLNVLNAIPIEREKKTFTLWSLIGDMEKEQLALSR